MSLPGYATVTCWQTFRVDGACKPRKPNNTRVLRNDSKMYGRERVSESRRAPYGSSDETPWKLPVIEKKLASARGQEARSALC